MSGREGQLCGTFRTRVSEYTSVGGVSLCILPLVATLGSMVQRPGEDNGVHEVPELGAQNSLSRAFPNVG